MARKQSFSANLEFDSIKNQLVMFCQISENRKFLPKFSFGILMELNFDLFG
jgi:hypothetical protein